MNLLNLQNLCIDFEDNGRRLPVVSRVSFTVDRGEILALVGESGCGKSISCMALTGLLPSPPAHVRAESIGFRFRGDEVELADASSRLLRQIRGGGISYIFQEPSVSLNPVFRVGDQIAEAITLHRPEVKDLRSEVLSLLEQVGIPAPESRIDSYPHELSGGTQQRIMIAMALASHPELLIADEPTTALDVTIQAQILELITRMCRERDMGVILVTHNLGIVSEMADRVAVMYAGNLVEQAPVRELLRHPAHPYTRALLAAVPTLGGSRRRLNTIPGSVPPPDQYPKGCRFHGRCLLAKTLTPEEEKRCAELPPPELEVSPGHRCRCFYPERITGEEVV